MIKRMNSSDWLISDFPLFGKSIAKRMARAIINHLLLPGDLDLFHFDFFFMSMADKLDFSCWLSVCIMISP